MKKNLTIALFTVLLSVSMSSVFAQEKASVYPTPKWVSDKGYWVVEDNVKTPKQHIIRFYNNDNALVYQETINGVKLRLNRKKVKVQLTKALDEAVVAWEHKQPFRNEDAVVMNILTK